MRQVMLIVNPKAGKGNADVYKRQLHNDTTTVFYYQFFITFLTARNH